MMAAKLGHSEMIFALLAAGADTDVYDYVILISYLSFAYF
jgi:hypothetical protein